MVRSTGVISIVLTLAASLAAPALGQTARADLAKARALYNQRQYDDAIAAAAAARKQSELADVASIVLARAHLERYRERSDPADLGAAREALGAIRTGALDARDQVELLLAIGESLFLEDDFGAAAAIFESGIERAATTDPALAESMMEWWGGAVERLAQPLAREPRIALFRRLADGAREELGRHPMSPSAIYWNAAALRGANELERAWDAAVAGWVRARLVGDRAASLRSDLDHLVLEGLVPDRVRHLRDEQRGAAESQYKADWELVKEKWK
jgi:hypothetical protein